MKPLALLGPWCIVGVTSPTASMAIGPAICGQRLPLRPRPRSGQGQDEDSGSNQEPAVASAPPLATPPPRCVRNLLEWVAWTMAAIGSAVTAVLLSSPAAGRRTSRPTRGECGMWGAAWAQGTDNGQLPWSKYSRTQHT